MTCQTPLSFEELSQYWAEALASAELDRIEEHLLGCATCSEQSARIAAVVLALRAFTPPAITRAEVERLRASGLKIAENSFGPGSGHSVHFSPELDLMIHRLIGFDLGNVLLYCGTNIDREHVCISGQAPVKRGEREKDHVILVLTEERAASFEDSDHCAGQAPQAELLAQRIGLPKKRIRDRRSYDAHRGG